MEGSTIAVTGSTGVVGGQVASALASAGLPQRLLVRTPANAPTLPDVEVRQASYGDHEASVGALRGVDVLFMVSAAENADRLAQHVAFVDAAAEAGVGHVVYTSFFGAGPDATFTLARDHFHTEERITGSGMGWTFLRDNLYLDYVPFFAGEGVLRGPAGDGRLAAVSQADVAASAVAVVRDVADGGRAHVGQTYPLTGPTSFSLAEAAELMTRVTGRPVRYVNETLDEAYASRSSYGAPDWQVDAWVSTYTAIAAGELDGVTDHVERLTGRAPKSLEQLLTER
jgi:NAD(P)H dehydrogenase (quinone)